MTAASADLCVRCAVNGPVCRLGWSRRLRAFPPEFADHEAGDGWVHGYGANHMWTLVEQTAHMLMLQIAYPADSEIEKLERKVEAEPDAPALLVSLTVHARRDVVLPFALHPTFAIPEGGVEIIACSSSGHL